MSFVPIITILYSDSVSIGDGYSYGVMSIISENIGEKIIKNIYRNICIFFFNEFYFLVINFLI